MKVAASFVMASPLQARLARPSDRQRRPFVVVAAGNASAKGQEPRRQLLHGVQGALLAAAIVAGIGLVSPGQLMPPAHADMSAPERRKLEAQQRRELLAKAREDALKKGGSEAAAGMEAATTEPAPAPGLSAADTKVEAANAAAEESNQTRQGLSASMMERLKKASGDYEKQAAAGPKLPREREVPQPSWLQQFNAPKEEPAQAPAAKEAPVPAAAPQQQPLQLPKVDLPKFEAPKYEAPQLPKLPSWGSNNAFEAAPAPALPSKPAPAPAAKVELPPLPPAPKESPVPKAQSPPAPAVAGDPGSYLKSLLGTPAKPEKSQETPKPEPPKLFEKEGPKPELPTPSSSAGVVKEAVKPGKRKGPLPLWLAESFVILGISGILYAIIRWNEELDALWRKASSQAEAAYDKIIPAPKA